MVTPDTNRPGGDGEPENLDGREPFVPDSQDQPDEGFEPEDGGENARDELELGDDDVSLPWLEGDDEIEDESGGSGQVALLALLAAAALALIVGGIWWFSRDGGERDLIADGSVIEAPDAPYKERPADPGGKTFEGTGDTSYAVSEGETRPARLGEAGETPAPGFDALEKPAASATTAANTKTDDKAPAATPDAAPAQASGPAVQVGAFSSRKSAEGAWGRLTGQHTVLSGKRYRVVEAKADMGTVFRLQALPGDMAAARSLCQSLKSAGQDCTVKN